MDDNVINWLLEGDVSIRYQTYRDLLDKNKTGLQKRIHTQGWGKQFLDLQQSNGHWGISWYRPKWNCTHYTLLMLKYLSPIRNIKSVQEVIHCCFDEQICIDGGITFWGKLKHSDICVDGMVLNYASYFIPPDARFNSLIDLLLHSQLTDGGWNCRWLHDAVHSSFHTTLSVLEGLWEYRRNGGSHRLDELNSAEIKAIEFLLVHKLYLSHRTGEVADYQMTRLAHPPHWHYDILKSLYHLAERNIPYDERLQPALDLLRKKRTEDGTWLLEYRHNGKMAFHMEKVGKPSRWNTLRALRVLRHFGQE